MQILPAKPSRAHRLWRCRLAACLGALSVAFPLSATEYYVSATVGTYAGTGAAGSPINLAKVFDLLNYDNIANEDLVFRFETGTYNLAPPELMSASASLMPVIGTAAYPKRIALIGNGTIPNQVILRWGNDVAPALVADDQVPQHSMLGAHSSHVLDRFVVENMTLDGNFAGQTLTVGPQNREGYKSLAIKVAAKTGRVRKCVIRNFGAQGLVPSSSGVIAGVESFPILIDIPEPTGGATTWPASNWPNTSTPLDGVPWFSAGIPWLIADNELYGMNYPLGGYATAVAVNPGFNSAPSTNPDVNNRLALVRGNLVRDIPIAFGVAGVGSTWCGRVRFEQNVVLNCKIGFNADTFAIKELDYSKSLLLDVGGIGVFGQAGVSSSGVAPHDYLNVADNTVRLRGSTNFQTYNDYYWTNHITQVDANGVPVAYVEGTVSEPTLPLARLLKTFPAGLTLQGRAGHVNFTANRFSTWDASRFNGVAPLPAVAEDNQWRPVFVVEPWTAYAEDHFKRFRAYSTEVTVANTQASIRPFDFAEFTALTDNGGNPLSTLNASTAPNNTALRSSLAAGANDITPVGRLGRVGPIFDTTANANLVGAVEATITRLAYTTGSTGKILVSVRVAEQRVLPFVVGGTSYYTVARPATGSEKVRLQFRTDVPGAWNADAQIYLQAADATGYAHFTIPAANLDTQNCVLAVRAWVSSPNPSGNQATGNFSALTAGSYPTPPLPNPSAHTVITPTVSNVTLNDLTFLTSAWAEAQLPVGQTVSVSTLPSVANEKSANRAKLVFTRTGSFAGDLWVNVTLPTTGTGIVSPGTYGTTGSADYYFLPTGTAALSPSTGIPSMVKIPNGEAQAVIDVVPRADDLFEKETVYLQLNSGTGYTPAGQTSAQVILYDGPTWSLIELTSMVYDAYQSTYLQATGSQAWAINHETTPKIAGWAQLPAVYGQTAYQKLGWWNGTVPNYINEIYQAPTLDANGLPIDRWYGLSTTTPTLVGQFYQRAAKWVIGSGLSYLNVQPPVPEQNLPGLPPPVYFQTGSGSAIFGVSVNNTYMVGKATPTTSGAFARPMRWDNSNPTDLVGSSPNFASGEARGVDDSGTTVGHVNLNYSKRGFRVSDGTINTSEVLPPHRLGFPPPNNQLDILWDSWAYGIAPRVNGNVAMENVVVGSASILNRNSNGTSDLGDDYWEEIADEMAVYWVQGGLNAGFIGVLPGHSISRALSINDVGEIVGWSGISESALKAFLCRTLGGTLIDLNDKHFVHNASGWSLEKATSINNAGWVVGDGKKGGQRRGFMLKKLTSL